VTVLSFAAELLIMPVFPPGLPCWCLRTIRAASSTGKN